VTVIALTASGAGSAGAVVVDVGAVVVVVGLVVDDDELVEDGPVALVVLVVLGPVVVDDVGEGSPSGSVSAPAGATPSTPAAVIAITTTIRDTVRARDMRSPCQA
jgi:hypothetical protein